MIFSESQNPVQTFNLIEITFKQENTIVCHALSVEFISSNFINDNPCQHLQYPFNFPNESVSNPFRFILIGKMMTE